MFLGEFKAFPHRLYCINQFYQPGNIVFRMICQSLLSKLKQTGLVKDQDHLLLPSIYQIVMGYIYICMHTHTHIYI